MLHQMWLKNIRKLKKCIKVCGYLITATFLPQITTFIFTSPLVLRYLGPLEITLSFDTHKSTKLNK